MRTSKINNSISYTSRNCPIKPFQIRTNKGVLYCREVDYNKNYGNRNRFFNKIGTFFLDIFANTSAHPFWKKCRKPTLEKSVYENYIKENAQEYSRMIKSPDTTFILCKNRWGILKAAIYTRAFSIAEFKEPNTLYIDSLAVDKSYRGNHIGKKLLNKVINSSKGRFDDVFLVAYKESAPFYKKLGFTNTEASISKSKTMKRLAKERIDYPDYAEFLEKSISDNSTEKWYQRADKIN